MRSIIQIVPNLPPKLCGVGDHAGLLGESFEKNFGISPRFVVTNSDCESPNYDAITIAEKSGSALVAAIDQLAREMPVDSILLHYSGYSYANRGLCFWLISAIKQVRKKYPKVAFATMFHELWASGPWYSSAFYLQPFQKQIVRSLVNLSSTCFTNRRVYASELESMDAAKSVVCQPVFSNFGEPVDFPSFKDRKKQVVLFQPPPYVDGSPFWNGLLLLQEKLPGAKFIIAGRERKLPTELNAEVLGVISSERASNLLMESQFGYFEYYDGYLGKSSLLAAYAAHGVACIMPRRNHSESDGLESGQHYVTLDELLSSAHIDYENVSESLHNWYEPHSRVKTAQRYVDAFHQLDPKELEKCLG